MDHDETADVARTAPGEIVTAALSTFAATRVGGEVGVAVGAAVAPAAVAGARLIAARLTRGQRLLEETAARMRITTEELVDLVADPDARYLLDLAMTAAAGARLDEKVRALARVVADGLGTEDSAKVDEAAILLRALSDIEVPHLEVLDCLAHERAPRRRIDPSILPAESTWPSWRLSELREALPGQVVVVHAVLATLTRHGLVVSLPDQTDEATVANRLRGSGGVILPPSRNVAGPVPRYRITHLGLRVLDLLGEIGEAETQADS